MTEQRQPHSPWQEVTLEENGREQKYIVYQDASSLTHRNRSGADYYYICDENSQSHVCIPRFARGEVKEYDFSKPDEIVGIGCGTCNEYYGYSYYYIGKNGKYTTNPYEDDIELLSSNKVVQCTHAKALIAYLMRKQNLLLDGLIDPSKEYIAGWVSKFEIIQKHSTEEI